MASVPVGRVGPIVSFDGTERCDAPTFEPSDRDDLVRMITEFPKFSVRGSGLSYCQAGAAEAVPALSTSRMRRILAFDADAGTVRLEAGCTIGELLHHIVARGFWFPVLPGHPQITVGGCVAFNTHGKTQHDIGQFSDHVVSLNLYHPDHGEVSCGPDERPDLFALTVGGMGLTGWILDVTLRVEKMRGPSIRRRAIPVENFVHAVETMETSEREGVHLYSWNDAMRRGDDFGSGIVFEESFVDVAATATSRYRRLSAAGRGRLVPLPLWNRPTARIVNRAYRFVESRRGERTMAALDAAFPINGKEGYFHAFGRRGFHEYQIIVPRAAWAETIDAVRSAAAETRACITLASLKLFSGQGRHLWFRGDGVCLTLDGPAGAPTDDLFAKLDHVAVELGAPVNLSKDSRLDRDAAAAIFPGYDQFRRELDRHDPARRVDSELRRRIGV